MLEWRKLLVDAADHLIDLLLHRFRVCDLLRTRTPQGFHSFERFCRCCVDRKECRHVRLAIPDKDDLADERLEFEETLDTRWKYLFSIRRNDQFLLAPGNVNVAFFIDLRDVAGVQPSILENSGSRDRIFVVAGEETRRP